MDLMKQQAQQLVEDIEKINEDCDKKYKVITYILNEVSNNNQGKLDVSHLDLNNPSIGKEGGGITNLFKRTKIAPGLLPEP